MTRSQRSLVAAAVLSLLSITARAQDQPPTRVVTLAEAVANAQKRQPSVRQAQAATGAAEARVEEARSGYLPQVTATALYQRTTGNFAPRPGAIPSGTGGAPPVSLTTTYNFFNFGITGTQLIYDFGQTSNRWRAAEVNVDASRSSERQTQNQVVYAARTAYYAARANKQLVKVAEDTLANQKRHLEQAEGFVKVGTQPEIALATARTAIANARVQLIQAQNNYEVAKAQLNSAMGVAGGTDYDVADEEVGPVDGEDQPADALVAKALQARPEVTTLDRQQAAQELTIRSLKGGYGPTLAAQAAATEAGTELSNLVPNWNIGLTLTWPLFQGGLTRGQVREAEANLSGIVAQMDAIKLQVRLDVEQARLAVRAAKASISAAEEALANARDQLRLAEGRYTQGVGSIIELGDAQVALTSASAQLVQAQFNLASARAQLLTALGRT